MINQQPRNLSKYWETRPSHTFLNLDMFSIFQITINYNIKRHKNEIVHFLTGFLIDINITTIIIPNCFPGITMYNEMIQYTHK